MATHFFLLNYKIPHSCRRKCFVNHNDSCGCHRRQYHQLCYAV